MDIKDRNIIILLMLLQLVITLPFINSFPIALDEPFSIFYAQQDINEFLPVINQGNNSPLHFILLHFWIKLFGISPVAVRSLSVLLSLIIIPVLFKLAKKITNQKWAVLTIALFIFSKFLHLHALEGRMYMLFILLFVSIVSLLYQIIIEGKNKFIWLIIINVLLFYTHYLAFFVFISEAIILLAYWRKVLVYWKTMLLGFLLFVVATIPGLMVLFKRIHTGATNDSWVPKPHISELYGNVLRFFNGTLIFLIICLLLLTLFFIKKPKLKGLILFTQAFKLLVVIFLVNYIGMYLFSVFIQPVFIDRYLLFTIIPMFLIFTYLGFKVFGDMPWLYILILGVPFVFNVKFVPKTNRSPDKIAAILSAENKLNVTKYIAPPWINLSIMYHYNQSNFSDYKNYQENALPEIYGLEEINALENFIFVNSREGYIKTKEQVVLYFRESHYLSEYHFLNDLYDIYYFKLNEDQ